MSAKTILLTIFIYLAIATSAGCGKANQMELTAADNGKSIEIKAGSLIIVDLEGNPSAGYNWEPKDLDTSLLEQVGDTVFKSANPGLIGSGGSITISFKSLKAGTTTLNLVYHRSWETDVEPLSSYFVTIIAK